MKKTIVLLLCSLLINSCNNSASSNNNIPKPSSSSILSNDLLEQLQNSQEQNNNTMQNALNQSKIAYTNLVLRFNSTPIDDLSFDEMKESLLTPMIILANSLNSIQDKKNTYFSDFNSIYSDILTNMLRGINNNLLIYQSSLETAQTILSTSPDTSLKGIITDDAVISLSNIFKSSEDIELFVTQLGQFTNVIPIEDTNKVLSGIRIQQNIIINGITNFISNGEINKEQSEKAYKIIASSLVNPIFLNKLTDTAKKVFGDENVALIKDEITPEQTNPNLTVIVIKESNSSFRKIRIEKGKVINQVITDTRNLSASDILNNSNVNIIKNN